MKESEILKSFLTLATNIACNIELDNSIDVKTGIYKIIVATSTTISMMHENGFLFRPEQQAFDELCRRVMAKVDESLEEEIAQTA